VAVTDFQGRETRCTRPSSLPPFTAHHGYEPNSQTAKPMRCLHDRTRGLLTDKRVEDMGQLTCRIPTRSPARRLDLLCITSERTRMLLKGMLEGVGEHCKDDFLPHVRDIYRSASGGHSMVSSSPLSRRRRKRLQFS